MRRMAWIGPLVVLFCSLPLAATPIVIFSPSIDCHTDYLAEMAEDLEGRGHQLYFTGSNWPDAAYNALQPDLHNYSLINYDGLSGLDYDGVLFVGAGWYGATYLRQMQGQAMPDYVDASFDVIGNALNLGLPIVGIGAGVYPLIFSELLPPGTQVAAYDCPDLYESALQRGLAPIVAKGQAPAGSYQHGPDAEVVIDQASGSWIGTASVPDTWYGDDQGSDLWAHYGGTVVELLEPFSAAVLASAEARAVSPWGLPLPAELPPWPTLQVINPGEDVATINISYCPPGTSESGCFWGGSVSQDGTSPTYGPATFGGDASSLSGGAVTASDEPATAIVNQTHGAATFDGGASSLSGGAVITSDEPIAAIVNQAPEADISSGERGIATAYNGLPSDKLSQSWSIPGLHVDEFSKQSVQIMNLGSSAATVEVTYMQGSQQTSGPSLQIQGVGQATVVPGDSLSSPWYGAAAVQSSEPVLVSVINEAPWNGGGAMAVHCAVSEPSTTWYLPMLHSFSNAAGTTTSSIHMVNPGATSAHVQITIDVGSGTPLIVGTSLDPGAEATIQGSDIAAGSWMGTATVTSAQPIAVSGSTRWESASGNRQFEAGLCGVTAGATHWVLPGSADVSYPQGGYSSTIVLQNPTALSTTVVLTFLAVEGHGSELTVDLDPYERRMLEAGETPLRNGSAGVIATARSPILLGQVRSWQDVLGLRERTFGMFGAWRLGDSWYLPQVKSVAE